MFKCVRGWKAPGIAPEAPPEARPGGRGDGRDDGAGAAGLGRQGWGRVCWLRGAGPSWAAVPLRRARGPVPAGPRLPACSASAHAKCLAATAASRSPSAVSSSDARARHRAANSGLSADFTRPVSTYTNTNHCSIRCHGYTHGGIPAPSLVGREITEVPFPIGRHIGGPSPPPFVQFGESAPIRRGPRRQT